MNPRVWVPAAVALLVGVGFAILGRNPVPPPPLPPTRPPPAPEPGEIPGFTLRPEPVRTLRVPRFEAVPAAVTMPEPITVRSAVRAAIEELPAREGRAVKKGDLLARLLPESWRKARAEAEKAGNTERVKEADEALAGMEVRAPVDGIVYQVHARLGEFPPIGKDGPRPFVILFDWRALRFDGVVPSALAGLVLPGFPVLLASEGDPHGSPGFVESLGEPREDGGVPVTARHIEPPPALPGDDGKGEILVPAGEQEVLVIPMIAVRSTSGRAIVQVVGVTRKVEQREVLLGRIFSEGRVEVRKGLTRFESILVPR